MEVIQFQEVIKSKKHAVIGIIICLVTILIYKYFKYYMRNFYLSQEESYLIKETAYTLFRAFSSIIGVMTCWWSYKSVKFMVKKDKLPVWTFYTIFLVIYFILKILCYKFDFHSITTFAYEGFFNIFTGISEEYLFRGLLMAGLAYLMNVHLAIFLSSFIFTIWHIDVVQSYYSLIDIMAFSYVFSYAYRKGHSLFSLSIFHFLIDQIHFGFSWKMGFFIYDYLLVALLVISTIYLVITTKASEGLPR
jgi:membrane protease YdiL (CAAX protease family)